MASIARGLCAVAVVVFVLAAEGRAEFQVNSYVQHNQTDPAVAMDDSGDFVVVWRSHIADGRGGGVYGRCFDANGTPAGEEFKINVSAADVGGWHPAVAKDSSGGFAVAWVAAREGDGCIVARMFDARGVALTDEFLVSTAPDAVESSPSIAMNSTGAFVVTWTSWYRDGHLGKTYVSACMFGASGAPMNAEFLVDDHPQACWPDVAADESDGFVITWIRMGDTYYRPYGEYVMVRRYRPDGTPAGRATQATEDLNNRWYGPSVAAVAGGGFVLTWALGPFPYDVYAQHFDAAGLPTMLPYLVNTCVQGNQGRPRIASAGSQDYIIVWDSDRLDGMGCSVCGQFCASDGEPVDTELTVNGCTEGRQWYPDAAMAPDGKCVVVWISEDQDGSGYGVFAEVGPH